jgi:hypothetical protein
MQYLIIRSSEPITLEENVVELIDAGWRLQGGVSVVLDPSTNELLWCQAMVRE